MRRTIGIGLLIVFVHSLLGVFPMQQLLRGAIRREVRSLVRTRGTCVDGLMALTFHLRAGKVSDAGFAWEEEEEFSFQGRMYDVVHRQVEGDRVIFHCIVDGREGALIESLRALGPCQDPIRSTDGRPSSLLKFMSDHFLPAAREPRGSPNGGSPSHVLDEAFGLLTGFVRMPLRPPAAA